MKLSILLSHYKSLTMQYTEIFFFSSKNRKFHWKNFDIIEGAYWFGSVHAVQSSPVHDRLALAQELLEIGS